MKNILDKFPFLKKYTENISHFFIVEIVKDIFYFLKNTANGFISFFHKDHLSQNIRMLRWNKLDTYIMTQFIGALLGSVILFVSIYELAQIFQDMRGLPEDVDKLYLNLHYLNTVPYWTFILQPFGFLFATVYVLSRLSSTREMIAMVSTGTSIYRLTFYVMLLSIVYYICIITFIMDHFVLPTYQKSFIYRRVALKQAKLDELTFLNDNRDFTIFGANNLLYLGEYYNATEKYIQKATVVQYLSDDEVVEASEFQPYDENTAWIYENRVMLESLNNIRVPDRMTFKMRIDAEKLIWDDEQKCWSISNGTIRLISEGGKNFSIQKVDYSLFPILNDPYQFFEKNWYPIDAMTVSEGLEHIDKLKRSGRSYHAELTKFHAKDAYPLGLIFVVMVGIGIVNMASKKVSVPINSALSMALFVLYYLMYTSFLGMAGKGDISPIVGGFGGSVIFGVLAFIFYARATT